MATYRQPSPAAALVQKRTKTPKSINNTTSKAAIKKPRHLSPQTKPAVRGKQPKTIVKPKFFILRKSARKGRFNGSYKF
jgi:hypothetical protein